MEAIVGNEYSDMLFSSVFDFKGASSSVSSKYLLRPSVSAKRVFGMRTKFYWTFAELLNFSVVVIVISTIFFTLFYVCLRNSFSPLFSILFDSLFPFLVLVLQCFWQFFSVLFGTIPRVFSPVSYDFLAFFLPFDISIFPAFTFI